MALIYKNRYQNTSKEIDFNVLKRVIQDGKILNSEYRHIMIVECLTNCIVYLDNQAISLKKNDILIIQKIHSFKFSPVSEVAVLRIFYESIPIPSPINEFLIGNSPLIKDLMNTDDPNASHYITFRYLDTALCHSYCNALALLDAKERTLVLSFEKQALIGLLFTEMLRDFRKSISLTDSKFPQNSIHHAHRDTQAGIILTYINMNIQKTSLKTAAAYFGYQPNYFSRLCRKIFNATFSDKVTEIKMELARRFLTLTTKSIDEIGFELGYKDTASFYKNFKVVEGVTPHQFRKNFQANNHLS